MKKKTRQYISAIFSLMYIAPSYSISFVSGSEPVRHGNQYIWWVENKSPCMINIEAWLSLATPQNKIAVEDIVLSKKTLHKGERAIITITSEDVKSHQGIWFNLFQKDNCGMSRLERIALN